MFSSKFMEKNLPTKHVAYPWNLRKLRWHLHFAGWLYSDYLIFLASVT